MGVFAPDAFLLCLWCAWLLDLLVGDPRRLPHPVTLIALLAERFERLTRAHIDDELVAGRVCLGLTLAVVVLFAGVLLVLAVFFPVLSLVVSTLLLASCFALHGLAAHALAVYRVLVRGTGSLDEARKKVAMIVGRETAGLDEAGIVRACVESVAENMSDGVVAPLLYAVLGGTCARLAGRPDLGPVCAAGAALLYKAVNTMDSLFGYKNEKYMYFGRAAARLDDLVNLVPARLSGLALVCGATLLTGRGGRALRILLRDRHRHASPNAGWPEAAMAGALGLQLGGEGVYFGRRVKKPTLGDKDRPLRAEEIRRAVRFMVAGGFFCLFFLSGVYFAWFLLESCLTA